MGRVLLIGLDSADAELVERWCAAGDLPTIAGLRRDGVWGRLSTSAEAAHVSAWPTLYTGASPGRHGLYHAYQVRPHYQGVYRADPKEMALPPFWRYLDEAGRRCIVFDAFMDYPLKNFRGTQILEYGTWTWFGRPGSTPRAELNRLIREVGPYPAPEHMQVLSVPDAVGFRDQLIKGAETKARAVRWLLDRGEWDMAFVSFGEPHGAGHYLWHTGDPEHPASRAYDISGARDGLRDVYMAVDRAIGAILERVDDDVTVAVVSGDGMGPNYSGCHHMPELLRRMGLLADGGGQRPAAESSDKGGGKKKLTARVRGMIPLGLRQMVSRCLPRSVHYRMSMKWVNDAISWERSSVFCIPNANEAYFRLNLRGREPRGIVEPGAQSEELIAQLQAELAAMVNPENGIRAAARIATPAEFPGPEAGRLPDLMVPWSEDARVLTQVSAPRAGLIEGPAGWQVGADYTGNHRPNAFIVARGPGVAAGTTVAADLRDVAPTVLGLLGVDPPAHFEGRPIHALS